MLDPFISYLQSELPLIIYQSKMGEGWTNDSFIVIFGYCVVTNLVFYVQAKNEPSWLLISFHKTWRIYKNLWSRITVFSAPCSGNCLGGRGCTQQTLPKVVLPRCRDESCSAVTEQHAVNKGTKSFSRTPATPVTTLRVENIFLLQMPTTNY